MKLLFLNLVVFLVLFEVSAYKCGNGVCESNEDQNTCFTDCYARSSLGRKKRLSFERLDPEDYICSKDPIFQFAYQEPSVRDTLNRIITNQKPFILPGIRHLEHGMDIATGEEMPFPLFQFIYCNESSYQIHDTWRGKFYYIPEQVTVDSYPICSFNSKSTSYEGSTEMSNEKSKETEITADASLRLGPIFSASYAFSKNSEVSTANSLQQKNSGSLTQTEAKCFTTRVQLAEKSVLTKSLSIEFLKLLANAKTGDDYINIMQKYGTYYYKTAKLGGKLTQIVSTSKDFTNTAASGEHSDSVSHSFNAGLAGKGASASASAEYSHSQGGDYDLQESFEASSEKSILMTYGGPPGAFGPSSFEDYTATTWGEWASNVDILPVPIDYTLAPISDLISKKWKNLNNLRIRDMWIDQEKIFYKNEGFSAPRFAYTIQFKTGDTACGPMRFQLIGTKGNSTTRLFTTKDQWFSNTRDDTGQLFTFPPNTYYEINIETKDLGDIKSILFHNYTTYGTKCLNFKGVEVIDRKQAKCSYFEYLSTNNTRTTPFSLNLSIPQSNITLLRTAISFYQNPSGVNVENVRVKVTITGSNQIVDQYFKISSLFENERRREVKIFGMESIGQIEKIGFTIVPSKDIQFRLEHLQLIQFKSGTSTVYEPSTASDFDKEKSRCTNYLKGLEPTLSFVLKKISYQG